MHVYMYVCILRVYVCTCIHRMGSPPRAGAATDARLCICICLESPPHAGAATDARGERRGVACPRIPLWLQRGAQCMYMHVHVHAFHSTRSWAYTCTYAHVHVRVHMYVCTCTYTIVAPPQVILNSPAHNAHLPHSILGFFVPRGASPVTGDLGYAIVIDVVQVPAPCIHTHMHACMHAYREGGDRAQRPSCRCMRAWVHAHTCMRYMHTHRTVYTCMRYMHTHTAHTCTHMHTHARTCTQVHRAFLAKYGLTEAEVPMLELDPYNWGAPFSHYHG